MKEARVLSFLPVVLLCLSVTAATAEGQPVADSLSIFVPTDTPKFIVLSGTDSEGRSTMVSSTAPALTYTLMTQPQHGILSGTAPALIYSPAPGFRGADSFTFKVVDGTAESSAASVDIRVRDWEAPLGIPAPEFGIAESYRMYDDPAKRNPALTYQENSEGGFYTHYVDSSHPSATNTDNPYGSPDKPRLTVPRGESALPVGSVVEIHNSADANGWGEFCVEGTGTADMPIFLRGVGLPTASVLLDIGYYGNAQYIIVDGINFSRGGILARADGTAFSTNHISVRNCEFHGNEGSGGVGITSWTSNVLDHIVLYNNKIHDNGVWDPDVATGDQDNHGIAVGARLTRLWVVDNEMYHDSGDGIQINTGESSNHIYVGRNRSHHNKQAGFWTKTSLDVIFSENMSYGHRQSSSSDGAGLGFQYDPKRVWFLFNESYGNKHGIACGSGNVGGREEFYFVGNVIHDVTNGFNLNGLNTPTPAKLVGNAVYNAQVGVNNGYYTAKLDIVDNILAHCGYQVHFDSDYQTYQISTMSYNLLEAPINIRWGSTYTSLSQFQAATGQCANCREGDPKFVAASAGNFNLQGESPAVDTGVESEVYQRFYDLYGIDIKKDIEGRRRPQGNGWDIGAYEYGEGGDLLYGDVSGDGEVTPYDAALTAQAAVEALNLTGEQRQKADVTGDGGITAFDSALIARKAVGLIDKFPVEE